MVTYSGLWNDVHGENYALTVNRSPLNRQLGRMLRKGVRSLARIREVIDTVAASQSINGSAAVTYTRVTGVSDPGNPIVNGGAIAIQTVTQIAAAQSTTAGDVANIDALVNFDTQPTTYPVDLSGNGGGGKLAHVQ